jgi:hypothetical protein
MSNVFKKTSYIVSKISSVTKLLNKHFFFVSAVRHTCRYSIPDRRFRRRRRSLACLYRTGFTLTAGRTVQDVPVAVPHRPILAGMLRSDGPGDLLKSPTSTPFARQRLESYAPEIPTHPAIPT